MHHSDKHYQPFPLSGTVTGPIDDGDELKKKKVIATFELAVFSFSLFPLSPSLSPPSLASSFGC